MATEDTVLEHLQQGRDALVQEVRRLTGAIEELDSVILRLGGAPGDSADASPAPAARRAAVRKPPARRAERRGSGEQGDAGGKSIRVHVLDFLGSEDRDFSLTEIIDHISAQGIQAHDDAVRSITIKLMKDGQVERVGRGQYRLAGRSSAPTAAQAPVEQPPQSVQAPAEQPGYVPPLDFAQEPNV